VITFSNDILFAVEILFLNHTNLDEIKCSKNFQYFFKVYVLYSGILELCYCDVQVLEPNSAMRTLVSLDEALSSYLQFSAFSSSLLVIN